MKTYLLIGLGLLVLAFIAQRALAGDVISPEEAARRVAAGTAVLIDVREPGEWRDGVVKGALLLPLSDLQGAREKWRPVLEAQAGKELILYCRSGNRSGIAGRVLAAEKFTVSNAGAFSAWKAAGQPVTSP
ncbi:MAG: rhodanese-like domain-containing protein [Opitutaceae bacterium]|jgi:rhodanese-related sulfurtransferase|nr:rhodanese-like domain-containing protein [Opitutaceae bacterium]